MYNAIILFCTRAAYKLLRFGLIVIGAAPPSTP
jgi:hypothetical protein